MAVQDGPQAAGGTARKAVPAVLPPDPRFAGYMVTLLRFEGGYANDPDDPGGETNFGVTATTLAQYHQQYDDPVVPADVKQLTPMLAGRVYLALFYDRYRTDEIADPATAGQVFDITVNPGPARAGLWAQQSVNALKGSQVLVEDGVVGSGTLKVLNQLSPAENVTLNDMLSDKRLAFYKAQVAAQPALGRFLNGWSRRAVYFRASGDVPNADPDTPVA